MAQNKEQLNLLLEFIETLCKQPGNQEFIEDLRALVYIPEFSSSSSERIKEIYEMCLEKNLRRQAEDFYVDFPLVSIKNNLIRDFIQMETHRRHDEFDEFCLSMFQQIEAIVNTLAKDERVDSLAHDLMFQPAYSYTKDGEHFRSESTYTVDQLLFGKNYKENPNKKIDPTASISSMFMVERLYCICYFVAEQGFLTSSMYSYWKEYTTDLREVYYFRNKVHREGETNDYILGVYNRVSAHKGQYYIKFLSSFFNFINKIQKGYSYLENIDI